MATEVDYQAKARASAEYYEAVGAFFAARERLVSAAALLGADPERALPRPTGHRVRASGEVATLVLDACPGTPREIADRTGLSNDRVSATLSRLRDQGRIRGTGGIIRGDGRRYGQTWERVEPPENDGGA